MSFLHGFEVKTINAGGRPIETAAASVFGVVITAPKGPVNIPTLATGYTAAAAIFGAGVGTIADFLKGMFDQDNAVVVFVNVLDPATHTAAVAAASYTLSTVTDTVEVAHDYISTVVVQDNTDVTTYVLGTDYSYDSDTGVITRIVGGAITSGQELHIAYNRPDDAAVTDGDIIGTVDAGTGARTGAQALLGAESVLGVRPRVIGAPSYTASVTMTVDAVTAVPVVAGMEPVAEKLGAILVAEGPNTNDANAQEFVALCGRRTYVVDPWVKITDAAGNIVASSNTGQVMGAIAFNDRTQGWHTSPSNTVISGIVGTTREIDFVNGDATSRANILNSNNVATIIRQPGGALLWGNRTASGEFVSHIRLDDIIKSSLQEAHLWAVDKNITANHVESMVEGLNAWFKGLVRDKIISGGTAWADVALNDKTSMDAGELYVDCDYGRYGVAEHTQLRLALNNDYTVKAVFG